MSLVYHYHDWADRVHPEDLPQVEAELQRCMAERRPHEQEYRIIWPDGTIRWIANRNVFHYDANGQAARMLGIAMDITERKQAEEALRDLNATLEAKVAERTEELARRARQLQRMTLEVAQAEERERKRMADILHDDLQQQLAGAKFHLSRLRAPAVKDATRRQVAEKVEGMVTDAMEMSRGLSHQLSPAVLYQRDLRSVFKWLAGELKDKHGLSVLVHAPREVGLDSDPLKAFLYRAARELLFNVVKHARTTDARVRLRTVGPYVGLTVSDVGRGFDPRGMTASSGFGLLSIRERVELLGGRLKVRSVPGDGCRVCIVMPNVEAQPTSPQAGESEPTEAVQTRLRVLVADDHDMMRQGLASLLNEEPDIEVVGEAVNGREAVDLAFRLQPDVVIMDAAMPLVNGDEATRQIRRHVPGTRVVALSMYDDTATVNRMTEAGVVAFLPKTVPSDELLAILREPQT